MGALRTECAESGVLLAAEGVHESSEGTIIRKSGPSTAVTDGPFSEAREVIGGFAVLPVDSRDQAIELGQRFPRPFDEVSVEVRRVKEFADLTDDRQAQQGSHDIEAVQGNLRS